MKQAIIYISLILFLFSCNYKKNTTKEEGKQVITVSILPQKTFIHKIAGNDFDVNVLIPPGASPAAYTLLPSQLKNINRSQVWFRIGYIGFEHSWKEKISQANRKMKVVDLSADLDLISVTDTKHPDKKHNKGVDPHTWMSPELVKQMCLQITEILSDLNPEKESVYKNNYLEFVKEIDELSSKIQEALKDYRDRQFITFHPSLSYYAREYGLIQHSLESGGKEPTPQHMAKVVELAKKEGIKTIYIQSEFDREHARVFAEEIEGEIVEVWPLNPAWAENLMEITKTLIDHF